MDDVGAVMDAVGSEQRGDLRGLRGRPDVAPLRRHAPRAVTALVLYGTFARMLEAPDYPEGDPRGRCFDSWVERVRSEWGGPRRASRSGRRATRDDRTSHGLVGAAAAPVGSEPAGAIDLMDLYREIDVRAALPAIAVPTLVVHRRATCSSRLAGRRYMAEHIPDAHYVELAGADHLPGDRRRRP